MLCSCREPFLELVLRIVPGLASAAMAACAALPDADMLTAINKQHAEQVAGRSQLVIPLLSGDGAVRAMAMHDWPLCRTHLNGSAAQPGSPFS